MQEGLEQDLSGKNSIIGRTLVIFTADVNGEFNEDVDEPRGCCVIGYDQAPAETADETDHHHHDDHYGSGYATAPAATAAVTNHYGSGYATAPAAPVSGYATVPAATVSGYALVPASTVAATNHYGSGYATAPAATAAGTNHYHSYQPSSSAYGGYTGHGSAQSSGQNYW